MKPGSRSSTLDLAAYVILGRWWGLDKARSGLVYTPYPIDAYTPVAPCVKRLVYLDKASRDAHHEGMVEAFVVASKAYHLSTPATFETIDTGHRFMLVVGLWNAPEVI